jgi:hypothetical protein
VYSFKRVSHDYRCGAVPSTKERHTVCINSGIQFERAQSTVDIADRVGWL